MLRLAWKAVKHNPKRLILTTVSIVLATSFVSGTFVLTNAMQNSFDSMFSEIYANIDLQVVPDDDDQTTAGFSVVIPSFPESWVDRVASVEGVEEVAPSVSGVATMLDSEGKPLTLGPPVITFNWNEPPVLDNVEIVSGTYPHADDEVVLDMDAAEKAGYQIGDTVTFLRRAESDHLTYTLVGIAKFGTSNALNGATLSWFTYDEAQRIARLEGKVTGISVKVADGYDVETVRASIEQVITSDMKVMTADEAIAESGEQVASFVDAMNTFILVFALIAVIVGAMLITNTFQTIITQRTRELGLLRAIAASPRQILLMILGEALIIGLIGSGIGLLVGYGLAAGAKALLAAFAGIGENLGALTVPMKAVVWGIATGVGTTIVAAMLPAFRASKITPMEALRDEASRIRHNLSVRTWIGIGFMAVAAGSVVVAIVDPFWPQVAWIGIAAGTALVGTILWSASIIAPLARGIRPAFKRMFRVDGVIAANNVARTPTRTANTTGAIILGVMLLTLMTTVATSIKTVVKDMLTNTTGATFLVGGDVLTDPLAPISDEELAAMRDVDGVTDVHFYGWDIAEINGKTLDFVGIDTASADAAYQYDTDPDIATIDDGEVFVSPAFLSEGYELGDSITIKGPDGTLQNTITGLYLQEGDPGIWITFDDARKVHHGIAALNGFIVIDPAADQDAVRAGLENAVADNARLTVQSTDEFSKTVNSFLDGMLAMLTMLLGLALVISIFGVANTLSLSVSERTREIGLLRAVGIRRGSVWRMITLESVFMSILGAILGAILGVAAGVGLVLTFDIFKDTGVTIPWASLGVLTIVAMIAGVIAAIVPATRASKLNILEAVTTE